MSEKQNVEYTQSWRDEYLKWVCGFANDLDLDKNKLTREVKFDSEQKHGL